MPTAIFDNPRQIALNHAFNVRDLGGLVNEHQQVVKPHRLLRSDDLSKLDVNDLQQLEDLPLHSVVDLRSHPEKERHPDRLPNALKSYVHLDILSGSMQQYIEQVKSPSANAHATMLQIYEDLALSATAQAQYRVFFEQVQTPKEGALLFHCSAGKDRTGLASALILSALNVSQTLIWEDYLLSNVYLPKKYAPLVQTYPHLADFFSVHSDYLAHAWQCLEQRYGSIHAYLQEVLAVDLPHMRALYLQDA